MSRPRGAHATSRARLAAASPHRITAVTPSQFAVVPDKLSYWLNDVDGICVSSEEAFAKAAYSLMLGGKELFIRDETVLAWATTHNVLNGAEILSVIEAMQVSGFEQDGVKYNDGTPSSVSWTDWNALTNAISQGPVKLGIVGEPLDRIVGTTNGWFATEIPAQSSANEDHCVSTCGYGSMAYLFNALNKPLPSGVLSTARGLLLFTWNTIGIIDWQSFLNLTFEAWTRTPTTVGSAPPAPAPLPTPVHPPLFSLTFGRGIAKGGSVHFQTPVAIPPGTYDVVVA